jgi:hypothetical protein
MRARLILCAAAVVLAHCGSSDTGANADAG